MMQAHKELDKFLDRSAPSFFDAIMDMARAYYGKGQPIPEARAHLTDIIRETMILADLNARKRIFMEYDAALDGVARFAEVTDSSPLAPSLTFDEAVKDLLTREPRLASSAAEVSRLYSREHVFAMARSAELAITKRVQEIMSKATVSGAPAQEAMTAIEEAAPYGRAYADVVFRTNASNAYNNGRLEQASDPDLADVVVGLKYMGLQDAFTRPNHSAGFGTIAATDDPFWSTHKPPLGYNCRCGLDFVSRFEAERMGLWKDGKLTPYYVGGSSFHADPGFNTGGVF